MRADRRGFLNGGLGFVVTACSPARADQTYTVVDAFNEIALAPNGSRCAVQKTALGINTILLTRGDLSEPQLLALPHRNWWIRDLAFAADPDTLLFTAGPPQFGGFDTQIGLYQLDLLTLQARRLQTGLDYNRAPVASPDGGRVAFAGRSAGASSLLIHQVSRGGGQAAAYSAEPFQFVWNLVARSDGSLLVNALPGRDPFDSLRIDQANGFQRVFLLKQEGPPDPAPFRAVGANGLGLVGQHHDEVLLIATYTQQSGVSSSRLMLMDPTRGTLRFVDLPQLDGLNLTGAAIAGGSGLIAGRGVDALAVQGMAAASIADLAARAAAAPISI